jgi:molybdenum cofactor biosynthesis enzyme MoaA
MSTCVNALYEIGIEYLNGNIKENICCYRYGEDAETVRKEVLSGDDSKCPEICKNTKIDAESQVRIFRPNIFRKCNFKCIFCADIKKLVETTKEITDEELQHIKEKYITQNIKEIVWTSGEWFVDKRGRDWYTSVLTERSDISLVLITNGYFWNEKTLDNISVNYVRVSLYGNSNYVYEKLTGVKNGWTKVKENLPKIYKWCKSKGVKFDVYWINNCYTYLDTVEIRNTINKNFPDADFVEKDIEYCPQLTYHLESKENDFIDMNDFIGKDVVFEGKLLVPTKQDGDQIVFNVDLDNKKQEEKICDEAIDNFSLLYKDGKYTMGHCGYTQFCSNLEQVTDLRKSYIKGDRSYCKYCVDYGNRKISLKEAKKRNLNKIGKFLRFSVFNNCNFNCKYCNSHTKPGEQQADIKYLYDNFDIDYSDSEWLEWISGEFFASKYGMEWYSYLLNKWPNLKLKLITNGSLWDRQVLRDLNIYDQVKDIWCTVYGKDDETYKNFTGVACFNKVMTNIQDMIDYGKETGCNFELRVNLFDGGIEYVKDLVNDLIKRFSKTNINILKVIDNENGEFSKFMYSTEFLDLYYYLYGLQESTNIKIVSPTIEEVNKNFICDNMLSGMYFYNGSGGEEFKRLCCYALEAYPVNFNIDTIRKQYIDGDRSMCVNRCHCEKRSINDPGVQERLKELKEQNGHYKVHLLQPASGKYCNMQCSFCDNKNFSNHSLSVEAMADMNKLDLSELDTLFWDSGEFFVNREIARYISRLIHKSPKGKLHLDTNALLWNEDFLREMNVYHRISCVSPTVYGITDQDYELRCKVKNGSAVWQKLYEIEEYCQKMDVYFRIRINVDDFSYPKIVRCAKKILDDYPSVKELKVVEVFGGDNQYLKNYKKDSNYLATVNALRDLDERVEYVFDVPSND